MPRHTNRLIHESSPYLLQHAHNPVDWYPWGEEALAKAAAEDKPILLSIGYSACHWCHVMERESFEDEGIAALMNEHFVNVKVDREERPDLDHIYQTAAQLISGQGGWPLTVFLTPDQRPFFAGTYFPPDDRFGRPGFPRVLLSLAKTYQEDRDRVEKAARQVTEALVRIDRRKFARQDALMPEEGDALLEKATEWLASHFDRAHGGFGSAPKFPNPTNLELFIRRAARTGERGPFDLAAQALRSMARGGIYDQLGGGFHRYATDAAWRIPHFEKMLYDNALLPPVYLMAHQIEADPLFVRIVRECLAYVEREMSHPEGGFYSAQDADSEGEEGKFFVWRPEEIEAELGADDAKLLQAHLGVTARGNFEGGTSVLYLAEDAEALAERFGIDVAEVDRRLADGKARLFAARERRIKPARDDKVIAAWTAMMASTFAFAARALGDGAYLDRAKRAVRFIEERLAAGDRLLRSVREGPGRGAGYLEDYAFFVRALIDLYESSFDRSYLEKALAWTDRALALFWDSEEPGFFLTPEDHETLIHRPKDWRDESIPSATGVAVQNLIRLHPAADRRGYLEKAEAVLETYRDELDQNPWGTASLLLAYDAAVHGTTEVVIAAAAGQEREALELAWETARHPIPAPVVYAVTPDEAASGDAPLLWRGKSPKDGQVTAYVCRGFACSPPATGVDGLREALRSFGSA